MTYIHQEYPKCKYSWAGKTVIVHNLEQEAALGGGWADTPAAFTPYRGPRPGRADRDDPLQWVDQWPVAQLSAVDRRRLKAQLLKADAAFWKAPDVPSAEVDTMRLAFVGIAFLEGHFVTPTIIGRRLELNALAVFMGLAFWTWLWGPMGGFLSSPLLIVALILKDHLVPVASPQLPPG